MSRPETLDFPQACPDCGAEIILAWIGELGLNMPLEPGRLSPLSRPPPGARIYENHPMHGWHMPWQPRHRGYPLHHAHECQSQSKRDKGNPMTADPFSPPSSATGITWADYHGALLLFTVHSVETDINTVHGTADAVRVDVAVLDGEHAGTEIADTLVFPKVLISQLRGNVGGKVLGRLGQGEKKAGQSPPWKLAAPTDDDRKAGLDYLSKTVKPPF